MQKEHSASTNSLAQLLKGGVIMDVTTPEQARIAEAAGARAVMALERIPADIRAAGGVSRMSDPKMIKEIKNTVSIPVMAKCRIGHIAEAQILEAIGHLNDTTQQVRSRSKEMLDGSQEVIQESENLEKATQEITGSMNEMALGVEEINVAVHQINELSGKNRENIELLMKEVSRFKVD